MTLSAKAEGWGWAREATESANPFRLKVMPAAVNFFQTFAMSRQGPDRDFSHSHRQRVHFLLLICRATYVYVLGVEDNETCFTFSFTALIRLLSSRVAPPVLN
jgi:hypothetical protein